MSSEESEDSEDDELAVIAAGVVVFGVLEADQRRRERRRLHRTYLTRPELLPNPRESTPWQVLYASRSDRAFITTMGFDCDTFEKILTSGFTLAWNSTPIPRPDTNSNGAPRLGGRSLDSAGALGLVLHYLSSSMPSTSLQQVFALIPTTVTRYIQFTLDILLETLQSIPEAQIRWLQGTEFAEANALIVARHPLLDGAFASGDGLKLPVETSSDPEIENATYNGWLHHHFMSNVFAFSPTGVIIAAIINAPGSWHDAKTARPLYVKLRDNTPDGYYLVADTAFPRGNNRIAGRIRVPLKAGQHLPDDPQERAELMRFDKQLVSFRQTAEWGMRALQGSFGRLRVPMDIEDDEGRANLIEVCVRLNNLRAICVGINQIRNVYMPIWRQADDDLWFGFENMLFADIRRRDRVARFHAIDVVI
ncbi:hypothetical protein FA95DRAFT_1539072 [Auriscalpium vulgare]|uniref:Uncharacterized protein n=1 Tax=Auriscalpium vulgare TaxID=40419 RepID=A0ACB8RY66_9AGAM|nr:hypothetical protein FA95DRAFT_1539072 [Auriscalpium vulgare]